MDIIFGLVLVVLARFLATAVVTLRCKRLSDMVASFSGMIYSSGQSTVLFNEKNCTIKNMSVNHKK
jgi:hypothetical protein